MITVHMIGNAHLDPVWLWRWPAGVGEALATCRTACDLLDDEPDVVFTRGDAWLYERVEALDPGLFARIKAHVAAGRWAVVGGWYVQPDCNLPLAASFRKHMEIGRRHAREKLGRRGHRGLQRGQLRPHRRPAPPAARRRVRQLRDDAADGARAGPCPRRSSAGARRATAVRAS